MSHVVTLRVNLDNKKALKTAFENLGGTWKEGVTTFRWWGRHVGDYPLPVGFSVSDMGKCHHAVNFPGINYEVGVIELDKLPADHKARHVVDKDGKRVYQDGSFIPMFDFINFDLMNKLGGKEAQGLVQQYKLEIAKAEARRKGFTKFLTHVDEKTKEIKLEIVTG
jgi:hypothetical protein